jgi:hypothetical protein
LFQGTLTVMHAVYGPGGPQIAALQGVAEANHHGSKTFEMFNLISAARGALQNLKAELETGMLGSLRQRIAGDVLTDFVHLARAALDDPGEKAKDVAAVLAAAAFEDVIRRMGASLAGKVGEDELQNVIGSLKDKGILQPPQLGIALSYLNFRNRALHAQWDKIERASVHSVLAFVEQLLLKHFQ